MQESKKRALITGISGQDGYYLSHHLLTLGYDVWGMLRPTSRAAVVSDYDKRINYVTGDLSDIASLKSCISTVRPTEIYNLAAQSFVGVSWKLPLLTADVNGMGALRLFEATREINPKIRIYQASTSEQFGDQRGRQSENTPFKPRSPYAVAKTFAHQMAINYRESYDMFIACGILFNHESPRRPRRFVTRKIAHGVVHYLSTGEKIALGNVDSKRDWGHAKDYVKAMHLMLQTDKPDDFVIGTGVSFSVKEFIFMCMSAAKDLWPPHRSEVNPNAPLTDLTENCYYVSEEFYRPADVTTLCANSKKAQEVLKWTPTTRVSDLARDMVTKEMYECQILK